VGTNISRSTWLARYAERLALQNYPNPLTACGGKVYSQNDEDGITFEILRRLGLSTGVFAEFGVGDGRENNTLALAAAGWSGFWVGGEDLDFDPNTLHSPAPNFHYQKAWKQRSNLLQLFRDGLKQIRRTDCTVFSLDLDGNDFYFASDILAAGIRPELF